MSSSLRKLRRDVQRYDAQLKGRSAEIYANVLKLFLQGCSSPHEERVLTLLKEGKYAELLSWVETLGSAVARSPWDHFHESQLIALIKKYPFPAPELKEKSRAKALEKFRRSEETCRRYNLKFRSYAALAGFEGVPQLIEKMRKWIRYVIGDTPDLSRIYSECGYGPGASVGVHGNSTNLARKLLVDGWTCTPTALPYALAAMAQDQHYWELILGEVGKPVCMDIDMFREKLSGKARWVQYNKIVTVPKTALVDRTIAVEPLLNGYLQKGVDQVLRQHLKRVGIDLANQSLNQDLARQGSDPHASDPFATIDLSSASDTISCGLVEALLPRDWFVLLTNLRSPCYELDGAVNRYEKFVSMGNGFCFPLETLIFASACIAAGASEPGKDFSVYGDDIIVRRSIAPMVIKNLWRCGFRHNRDKTFLEGPFRESCGADWFDGFDVRPLALKDPIDSLQGVFKFFNLSLQKPYWALAFMEVREYLYEMVPARLRLSRPCKGELYGAFEVPLDRFMSSPFSCWDRDIQAWGWLELVSHSVPDKDVQRRERYHTVLTMAAVRGSPSSVPFSKRNLARQSVRRLAYAGATSTWLPGSSS